MVNHKRLGERGVNHPNRTRHMGLRTAIEHVGNIAKGTQNNLFINRFLLICRNERLNALVESLPLFRKCCHVAPLRFLPCPVAGTFAFAFAFARQCCQITPPFVNKKRDTRRRTRQ